jgi:RNA recognition motif-containing protein
MGKRIYLGNLPYTATEQQVRDFLAPRAVVGVELIADRETGRPRGFGFAEFAAESDAHGAVADRNGYELEGRPITVSLANEKPRGGGRARERDRRDDGGRRRRN